jgi:hypothetical protein
MRGRIAVALALALAAGCSGGGGRAKPDGGDAEGGDTAPETPIIGTAPPPMPDTGADHADAQPVGDAPSGGDAGLDGDAASGDATLDGDVASGDTVSDGDAGDAPGDVAAEPVPSLCEIAMETLTVPSGPVFGVFGVTSGARRNDVVSCGGDLLPPGPESIYTLQVDEAMMVEIRVDSDLWTVVALRGGCTGGVSEIACGEPGSAPPRIVDGAAGNVGGFAGFGGFGGPFPSADGGFAGASGSFDAPGSFDGGGSDANDASAADASAIPASFTSSAMVRARLKPGTYTILVDQPFNFSFDPAAYYALTVRSVTSVKNASCASPMLLSNPATASSQELDFASAPSIGCGTTPGTALYYSIGVGSGQRLTARATPNFFGDQVWQPRMEVFASCSTATCLAEGHASAGTTQQLDWINNGPNWRLVLVAVSSDTPSAGARFDLTMSVDDQRATCSRPTAVSDGTILLNQDVLGSLPPDHPTCNGATDHALYYAAQLLPQQQIDVAVVGSSSQTASSSPAFVAIRRGCDSRDCVGGYTEASFTNTSNETMVVIIEAFPINKFSHDTTFDLHVSIPLPPPSIIVVAADSLVTSESGTTVTFQVKLGSPPTADVTIPLSSDRPTEGSVSPASLVFTTTNWDQPQTVTIKGVDDQVSYGPQPYNILTGAATSSDPRYDGLDADDVAVTNLDDDAGLVLVGAESIVTTEWGGSTTFQVRLDRQPSAPVHVPFASTDTTEGTVSPAELVFTSSDWNTPKEVTVTGVDDVLVDGTQAYAISIGPLTSTDPFYAGLAPPALVAHNRDDDFKPVSPKLVSGNHVCQMSSRQQVAVDDFGTICVAVRCEAGILTFASSDGGATFSDPVTIPNTETVKDVRLAAGRGGVVYLFYDGQSVGALFTLTRDGGVSWAPAKQIQAPSTNGNQVGSVRIGAGADTVVLGLSAFEGGRTTLLWHSFNAGRSFAPHVAINSFNTDLFVRPDGKTVWLNTDIQLRKSTDGGVTFTFAGTPGDDTNTTNADMNDTSLFAGAFSQLALVDLTIATGDGGFGGAGGGQVLATRFLSTGLSSVLDVKADAAGNVFLLGDTDAGNLRVARKAAADTTVGDPKSIGPRGDAAGLVTLSPTIVGAVFSSGNLILFASTTAP